jgi:hypothetical protein
MPPKTTIFFKRRMSRRALLMLATGGAGGTTLIGGAATMTSPRAEARDKVTLYRDPGCECCENYVGYLRQNGFDVRVKSASPDQVSEMSRRAGIPSDLEGCHVAQVAGYVVGGLVPVAALHRLLKDHPPLKGITLPGMPPGAPGMTGTKEGELTVFAIPKEGKPTVFTTF